MEAGYPKRILIADDHAMFREGLRHLIETNRAFRVVGEADQASGAIAMVHRLQPDLLLLDMSMPGGGGLEVLRSLSTVTSAGLRTIVVTAGAERTQMVEAVRLGARGIVFKEWAASALMECLQRVVEGQYWLGKSGVGETIAVSITDPQRRPARPANPYGLTPREMAIVPHVVRGETNRDIAEQFSVREDTIKHHLSNIFDKLGVYSRLELALFAINHRLVEDAPDQPLVNFPPVGALGLESVVAQQSRTES